MEYLSLDGYNNCFTAIRMVPGVSVFSIGNRGNDLIFVQMFFGQC